MAYLDFTQIYTALVSLMLVVTGFYALVVDRRSYASRDLVREAKWSKRIGVVWMILGVCLYISGWVWRNFIW